jgi:hypothetical protein
MFKNSELQKNNLENLENLSYLLFDYEYFICYGTLLGHTRDGKIISGDDDIDILINIKDKQKALGSILKSENFKINNKVSNDFCVQFINKNHKLKSFVDLYFYINKSDKDYIIEKQNFLAIPNNPEYEIHIPKKFIFPLKKSTIFKNVNLPQNPIEICNFIYGDSWMKPIKKHSGYRMEIKNNKPLLIRRSKLGYLTRYIKNLFNNKFKKK